MNKYIFPIVLCLAVTGCAPTTYAVKEIDGYCASDTYIILNHAEYDALRPGTQQDVLSHDAYWKSRCGGKNK